MARGEQSQTPEDPGWAHLTLIDGKRRKVKCKYCGKEIHGGITRGKQHLAGVRGEVKQCDTAPRAVRDEMRACLLSSKDTRQRRVDDEEEIADELSAGLSRRHRRDDFDEPGSEDSDEELTEAVERERERARARAGRGRGKAPEGGQGSGSRGSTGAGPMDSYVLRRETAKQPKIKHALRGVKKSAESAGHAFKSICKWFFHAGVPAHAAESEYFQPMIDAVADAGPGFKAPSRRDIYGRGLQGEVEELHQWVESFKHIWVERGCTIMCDGWTGTTKKSMINFLVYCIEGTIFMKSVDASNYEKNANYLFHLMDDMVAEIGEVNVVQIVTDNEASYKAAGKKLMEKRRHLYWLPCAAHCLDLILEDIGKDKNVKKTVAAAQLITRYIYGHPRILNMFRDLASGGRDLIRAGPTRFASNFLSLQSVQKFKNDLRGFMYNTTLREYVDKQNAEGQMDYLDCCHVVEDNTFWHRVDRYLKVVSPIVKVLRMVDGDDKNDMGYLYEAMDRAKMELRESLPREYKKWWTIIDHRWENTLHHDLHAAGYFLNPRLMYGPTAHVDAEVVQGTLNVLGRLSMTPDKRLNAELQMDAYRMRTGTYSDSHVQYAVERVSPVDWWIMVKNRDLGSNALADLAIRVLSQTTSASQCERNWSTFSLIHSKVRNRLKAERLEQLVYCHYNMRLRIKNMRLRQQLRDKRHAEDLKAEIDVDALFDDDNPLQSWVEIRETVDEPVFDPLDSDWAEGILEGDEPRDPEFRIPAKRARGSESAKGKEAAIDEEPARYSESDSRAATPRMVKPPPELRRSTSVYGMGERAAGIARNDPAIEKMKQIYVRRTPRKSKEETKKEQIDTSTEEKKKTKPKTRRLLVTYASDDDDDDDDDDNDDDDPGVATGATGAGGGSGTYSQSQTGYGGHSQAQGQYDYGHESQDPYGYHSGQGHYEGGQHNTSMYGWSSEPGFQFQPVPARTTSGSTSYGEASSSSFGFQATQEANTPRGIQRGMNDLAASLFGYSAYAEYMYPVYGNPEQPGDEGEGSSGYWPQ